MIVAGDQAFAQACNRSRLRIPRQALISRPRLIARLDDSRDATLCLVQAPAGYGKSSLLQQWSSYVALAGSRVAWLSLDETDREPVLFVRRLLRSLEEAGHPADPRLTQLL